jgi:spore coat polysaccharide biosynthesis protein SpsF
MPVVAIIQARVGSTRLPGKVLMDLSGKTMLERVVVRVQRAQSLDAVVVATTASVVDDAIADLCTARQWPCVRGSEHDVLDRYYAAATRWSASVVVRITADCPVVEPSLIDQVVATLEEGKAYDYVSNTLEPRTYPRGLDVEAFTFRALETAWREDRNPSWREHVTPFIYHHPEMFRLRSITREPDLSALRLTVDTPEDLQIIRWIYDAIGHDRFTLDDVLDVLRRKPEWAEFNRHVQQKSVD